jgi:hypothetical protein
VGDEKRNWAACLAYFPCVFVAGGRPHPASASACVSNLLPCFLGQQVGPFQPLGLNLRSMFNLRKNSNLSHSMFLKFFFISLNYRSSDFVP